MIIFLSDNQIKDLNLVMNGLHLYLDGEKIYKILSASPNGLHVMEILHEE
jgi:hypothetical protein